MLDLLDYRRRVAEMYRLVRAAPFGSATACAEFRKQRDELFRNHAQSALDADQRAVFRGLEYFDYDPAYCVEGQVDASVEPESYRLELGDDGTCTLRRFALVYFSLPNGNGALPLYWIAGYGGGVFLPFRDATCGKETYGGGRYLFDTIKGADLGSHSDRLRLDFNYAYNPSCAYNARWVCPLAPPASTLRFAVRAGERSPAIRVPAPM